MPLLHLFSALNRCCAKQIVRRHIVKFAESHKMANGHFIRTTLITSVHGLRGAKDFRNLRLGQVVIFTQTSDFFDECPHPISPCYQLAHSVAE